MAFNPILIGDEHVRVRDGDDNDDDVVGVAATTTAAQTHAHEQRQQLPAVAAGASSHAGKAVGGTDAEVMNLLHSSDIPLLTSKTPLTTAVRRCLQQYYFDYTWRVAFPQHPAVPLLYYPDVYTQLLHDPAAIDVMQCELDAMTEGVLHRIPLAYHLLDVDALREARAVAQATEQHIAALQQQQQQQQQQQRAGALSPPPPQQPMLPQELQTWRAEDINPLLEPADAALLDAEFDSTLLLQRDLPSLTLMQRPLYTDIGLVPQEQRHAARLARIVPSQLRSLAHDALQRRNVNSNATAASAAAPLSTTAAAQLPETVAAALAPSTRMRDGGSNADDDVVHLRSIGNAERGHDGDGDAGAATSAHAWRQAVLRSFRHAREVDRQYASFIAQLVECKLGLDARDDAHVRLARALWRALLRGTTREQQRDVWCLLCRFSSSYNGSSDSDNNDNDDKGSRVTPCDAAARELFASVAQCGVPHAVDVWQPLLQRYVALLAAYARSLPGGVAQRKEQLRLSGRELDLLYSGGFCPDLVVGKALQRSGSELGDNRVPLPVFPVEVLPVYPSGFDRAAAMARQATHNNNNNDDNNNNDNNNNNNNNNALVAASESDALDYLGEGAEAVRHITLPGVTRPRRLATQRTRDEDGDVRGAHVFVAGTHLLLADDAHDSTAAVHATATPATAAADGDDGARAVSYHMSGNDTFELLLENDANTSSYLLRVMHGRADDDNDDDDDATRPRRADGAANADGRYCVYDRVGVRADYVKATHANTPPPQRYVVLYRPHATAPALVGDNNNNSDSDSNNQANDEQTTKRQCAMMSTSEQDDDDDDDAPARKRAHV